jgi:colicin import membrane protein
MADKSPEEIAAEEKAAAEKAAADKKKKDEATSAQTSAETGAGGKTAKEIALEKKVATLEDDQNSLRKQLEEATAWIKKQTEAPPAAKSGVLEEVNEFLGWGTS